MLSAAGTTVAVSKKRQDTGKNRETLIDKEPHHPYNFKWTFKYYYEDIPRIGDFQKRFGSCEKRLMDSVALPQFHRDSAL
ncbi:hypothetical protein EGT51_05205 [Levilactobacillus suantsaiihabitans]|uniref:Uncharacterized protein n=1 Tax=Levilactobacillus suantsaiihabitans TaxID=2487722 RepID=A0A4Z0J953_9LACO|nr:hypothetical protein EGT51_05205 [Levilactobacillus suantsaiihabitans]